MRCERCRELVSARLDGEDEPGPDVDRHLDACPECRGWADRAAAVTRLARTGPAVAGPDLTAVVVAASRTLPPVVRRRRTASAVRAGLGAIGAGQVGLAASGVVGVAGVAGHDGMQLDGASAAHFAHETSAWNLALGIGFLAVAFGGARLVAGLVPVIGAFVGVLAVLSGMDLVAGRVEPDRILAHGLVAAGFVLLLLHRRVLGDGGGRGLSRRVVATGRPTDHVLPFTGPTADPGAVAREDRRAA